MSEPSEDEGSLFVSYQAFVFIQLKGENIGEVSTQNNNKVSKRAFQLWMSQKATAHSNRCPI